MKATVKQVPIKQRLSRWDLIRFQISTYCILRRIQITDADIDMLTLLAIVGKIELTAFCELLNKTELSLGPRVKKKSGKEVEYKYVFNSLQSARNAILKISKIGLIKQEGKSHIKVELSHDIEIHTEANLLINYQFLCIASD